MHFGGSDAVGSFYRSAEGGEKDEKDIRRLPRVRGESEVPFFPIPLLTDHLNINKYLKGNQSSAIKSIIMR